MRKLIGVTILIVSIITILQPFKAYASENFEWVLVEVMDYANDEGWVQSNLHESYNNTYSYARSNYAVHSKYIGRDEDWRNPPKIKGEGITLYGSFSGVPQRIKAGEEVSITIELSVGDNSLSFFTFWASSNAYFDKPDIKPGSKSRSAIRFVNDQQESNFIIEKANDYANINEVIKASAPQGSNEGDQISIITAFYRGISMGTSYIYEWREEGWKPSKDPFDKKIPHNTTTERKPYRFDFPDDFDEVGPPADIYVTDMYGEVFIHVFEDGLWDAYNPVLSHNIPENAVITTGFNSGLQLYIEGVGTFVVKEDTHLKVGSKPEPEGKISIFFGHLWGRVKEIYETGELNFPMSQAVAGIKATTFELYDDGETSTIRVYEGLVDFESISSDNSVMVGSGETAKITGNFVGQIENFDIDTELLKWDENVKELTLEAIEEYQLSSEEQLTEEVEETASIEDSESLEVKEDTIEESSSIPWTLVLAVMAILLLVIIAFLIKK